MKNDPIYYINHFSLLKRPAVWSRYEFWAMEGIGFAILILTLAAWVMINHYPAFLIAIVLLVSLPGGFYNYRKGRERAERYKRELANGIPFYYGILPPGSYGPNLP